MCPPVTSPGTPVSLSPAKHPTCLSSTLPLSLKPSCILHPRCVLRLPANHQTGTLSPSWSWNPNQASTGRCSHMGPGGSFLPLQPLQAPSLLLLPPAIWPLCIQISPLLRTLSWDGCHLLHCDLMSAVMCAQTLTSHCQDLGSRIRVSDLLL